MKEKAARIEPAGPPSPAMVDPFGAFFGQSAVGIAQIETATGRFLRVNQRYCDLVGYSHQEMEQFGFQTLTHPADLAAVLDRMRRLLAGEIREFTMEKRYRRKNGELVWVNLTVSPLWAPGQPPSSHVAVVEDITAHRQAQATLLQRGDDLACLLEVSGTLAAAQDLKTVLQASADGASRLLGLGGAAIYLREGEWLDLVATTPPLPPEVPESLRRSALADHSRIQEALFTGRPVLLPDTATAELNQAEQAIIAARQLRTMLFLPLVAGEQKLGTLVVGAVGEPQPVSDAQIDLGRTLAHLAALAVVNALLCEATRRGLADRQRAEVALRESELRFRTLADSGQALVWTSGPDKKCDYFNQTWLTFTGRALEQELGDGWIEGVHPDDLPRCLEVYTRAFDRRERFSIDYRLRRHDGEFRWIQDDGSPRYDSQGNFLGYIGHCLDITERKRVELKLRESEALYHDLVETSQDLIWQCDAEGRYTYLNPAWETVFGYRLGEMLGRPFADFQFPEHAARDAREFARLLRGGSVKSYETVHRAKDGRALHLVFNAKSVADEAGRVLGTRGTAYDITERKQAEAALRRIEWMLTKSGAADLARSVAGDAFTPAYGDLLSLNTHRLILNAVGRDVLADIVGDYLDLLDTSAAVYERDGDYALGLFSSGWCRFMDEASRNLCETADNRQALACGLWHCHESCWTDVSKRSMETGEPVDRECAGGLHLYAVPIRAGGEIIGSINVGYGDPPRDPAKLRELAAKYKVDASELARHAEAYESRPPYIIELAKRRLAVSARLIGEIVERRRAVVALSESESRLREIIERAPFGAHSYELQAGVGLVLTAANRSADRILGIDHSPLIGRSIEEAFPGLRGAAIPDVYRSLAAGEGSFEDEQVVYEHGEIRGAFAIQAFHTGPQRMTVLFRDVTERVRGEAALREAEARYRSLFDNALEGIYQTTPEGAILAANPAMARMLGYASPEELICHRRDLARQGYADPRKREEFRRLVEANGTVVGFEYELLRKDGSRLWVSENARAVRNKQGHVTHYEGSMEDITERKRAEAELRANESLLRAVVDNIPFEFWARDREGRCTMENAALRAHWGSLLGKRPEDSDVSVEELAVWLANNRRAMAGDIIKGEVSYQVQGETRFYQNILAPIRVGDEILGSLGFNIDITERKKAEEERERLQSQLTQAQKMESVGRLAGGVAHDFNNMLQAILGNAALALREIPPESPLREYLEEVEKSAQRSADLTRQLLAFARKQTIAPKVLDLNDTVASMLKMLRRLIGEDIDLSWKPGAELWPVNMDPSQIDQVLANLCVNARDAIAGVGMVTIETANITLDDTYVATHPEVAAGDYVLLAVIDTGKGMDAETLAHLFEPFFTTKEQGKGTGLGLATVFGIVKQNKGSISVHSAPGQGSTFKIYLPRAEAEVLGAAPVSRQCDMRGTETLLLVEDEDQILNLAQRILRQHGYTVLAACSPEAAVQLVGKYPDTIHLLITDVVMPGMNGRELYQRLLARKPGLRCLYMSGYTADVIAHHGVLDEGVLFLQKPFTIESLAQRIREALKPPAGA